MGENQDNSLLTTFVISERASKQTQRLESWKFKLIKTYILSKFNEIKNIAFLHYIFIKALNLYKSF